MKRYLCTMLSFVFLAPNIVAASGADDTKYYGLLGDGTVIQLHFLDETYIQQKNTGQFTALYGAPNNARHAYCVHRHDDKKSTLECKSELNETPGVIYGNMDDPKYEERVRAIEKQLSLGSEYTMPLGYFVCVKGCDKRTADVLIWVVNKTL